MIDISAVRFTVAGTYPVILTYTSLQTKETYTETFEVVVLSEEQSTLPAFLGEYTYADYGYTLTLEKESLEDFIKNELYSNFKENQDLREKCEVYKNQIKKYKNKINELRRAN